MFIAMAALAAPAHTAVETALAFAGTQLGVWTLATLLIGALGAVFRRNRALSHPAA